MQIGEGAQSTLGGTTFLRERYVWRIIKKFPNFTSFLPEKLARNINKIPEFLSYFPVKLTKFPNFTQFLPENAQILHNNCQKNIFRDFFLGGRHVPPAPVSYAYDL